MIQGLGGLMSLTGRAENEDGAGPVKVGVALTDILTGLYSTSAILAALAHRDQGGPGSISIWLCLMCRWRVWRTRR